MKLGNRILELRKKNNLSQENLAEKLNISRQTISKWELDETAPDLKQAKNLSKIFNVSLDELADNDIKDILTEKISNTEKLAGLSIKWLKIFIWVFLIVFTGSLIYKLYNHLSVTTYAWFIETKNITCTLQDKTYSYKIEFVVEDTSNLYTILETDAKYKKLTDIKLKRNDGSLYLGGIIDLEKYEYYYQFEEAIFGNFEKNGGYCKYEKV